jgi:hypothetical protein
MKRKMNYKDGKWAKKILELQHNDGSWGYFHSLSKPTTKQPITTEQALRRLEILGYTIDDKPVKKSVKYMENCLTGKLNIPDRDEKRHPSKIYNDLMLATWIRRFTDKSERANNTAQIWYGIIKAFFQNGYYDYSNYVSKFESTFKVKMNPKAGRFVDFVHFYPVSLLANFMDKNTEKLFFKYILEHDNGIYYLYSKKLSRVPKSFQDKTTNDYIMAIELLSKYKNPDCKKQLQFVIKWLKDNMQNKNEWDMGTESKDGINFPLSDSWKKEEDRIKDCSYRIINLMEKIKG